MTARHRRLHALLALLILFGSAPLLAQQETQGPKTAPPPLFPKHRRGIYRTGDGPPVLDSTPQSPPLDIDDPSVPDAGQAEINLTTHSDLAEGIKNFEFARLDFNYGVMLKPGGHELPSQIKLEFPLAATKPDGEPLVSGIGPFKVGLKFNFYENEQTGGAAAFYPQFEFAIGATHAVEKGLAEPGQTLILPILLRKDLRQVTLVVNAEFHQPIHDPERVSTGKFSVGIGRAITRQFVVMAAGSFESAFDLQRERETALTVGVMRSVGDSMVLYADLGQTLFSDDGLAHTRFGVGLKVLTAAR